MTKTNKNVISDFVRSTWFGQDIISHSNNLIAAHDILLSYGVPVCVFEHNTPYPFKIRKLGGKHAKTVKLLIDEISSFSNTSWKIFAGKLNASGNDRDPRRKVISCDGNMPYRTK